jgi:hypothetical protein
MDRFVVSGSSRRIRNNDETESTSEYFLWRGGYENKHKIYINTSEARWKWLSSIKHPKTLTDAAPEPIILYNAFPKRKPPNEGFPLSGDWRSKRMPYRSEVRRAARAADASVPTQPNPNPEDSFAPDSSSASDSISTDADAREPDLPALIGQLRRSHAALLHALERASHARLRATASRRPAAAAAAAAEAAAIAVELAAMHAARSRLEREVRAAMAAR